MMEVRVYSAEELQRVGIENEADVITRPVISYWKGAVLRFKKNHIAMFAFGLFVLFLFFTLFGPALSGENYTEIDAANRNIGPNGSFWFGTDQLGRDLFSRIWIGARLSVIVALVCSGIQIVFGSIYGGIMAYFGGKVDAVMMRIIEVVNSFPSLLVTLLIMMVVGKNVIGLLIAMSITSWVGTARIVRGQIMLLRESEYVKASQLLGGGAARIIKKHLLPNTISLLILDLCSSIPDYIFTEASLSFLGMGLGGDIISLGVLISDGKTKMQFYPWQMIFPAVVLVVAVLAFNLIGDGLRDALDPKTVN